MVCCAVCGMWRSAWRVWHWDGAAAHSKGLLHWYDIHPEEGKGHPLQMQLKVRTHCLHFRMAFSTVSSVYPMIHVTGVPCCTSYAKFHATPHVPCHITPHATLHTKPHTTHHPAHEATHHTPHTTHQTADDTPHAMPHISPHTTPRFTPHFAPHTPHIPCHAIHNVNVTQTPVSEQGHWAMSFSIQAALSVHTLGQGGPPHNVGGRGVLCSGEDGATVCRGSVGGGGGGGGGLGFQRLWTPEQGHQLQASHQTLCPSSEG